MESDEKIRETAARATRTDPTVTFAIKHQYFGQKGSERLF